MVRNNTVIILGAGASRPYGYPTGKELSEEIKDVSKWKDFRRQLEKKYWVNSDKRIVTGFDVIEYHFGKSRGLSIDGWLAKEGNHNYLAAGKLLISYFIAEKELPEKNVVEEDKDWYQQLLNKLTTPKLDDFGSANSKLSIITFNYDRSLEHYLLTAMQSTYIGRSEHECWNQLKSIPIIHVYGQVGELPIEDPENGVDYGDTSEEAYKTRAKGLQIIPDVRDEASETRDIIQNKIREADRIYFIGFSYDETNLNILGFPFEKEYRYRPSDICGSALGLESGEIGIAKRITTVSIRGFQEAKVLTTENADAYTFFRRVVTEAFA